MNNFAAILIYLSIVSICGKSINININKFNSVHHRLRNTSLRVIVFNEFYKHLREKSLELLDSYGQLINSQSTILNSCFYDLVYQYYSMEEEDRSNLELIINLMY